MPPIDQATASPIIRTTAKLECSRNETPTHGEFRAQAVWISGSGSTSAGDSDAASDDNTLLDEILAAIVNDVQGKAAGARAAIAAEYGGKITHARKYYPRDQVAGAVRSFKEAQAAALVQISRDAQAEIASRREDAIRRHSGPARLPKISVWGGPTETPTPE